MNLPYSDNLNIGYLSRLFDRNRVFNCYKYFWMLAILNKISVEKTSFTYNELLDEMIVHAWYMVTEFNLKLGPCNTTDNLEEVVRYISTEYKLASTVEEGKLHEFLRTTENARIDKYKEKLIVNVPYCLQSPFYPAIKSPGKSKIAEINRQKHLLYYFMDFQKLDTRVEVNDEWAEYLIRNKEILKDWVNYNLIGYLQDRNPSVPGIADKLAKPKKRNLTKVTDYWNLLIELDPSIRDIYGKINLSKEKISIDHFVPWQFVAHDELWNLSPTTKTINSSKGNKLPRWEEYYEPLALLEYKAYRICDDNPVANAKFEECAKYHINNMDVRNSLYAEGLDDGQFPERLGNILKPVYESAKLCGFQEW